MKANNIIYKVSKYHAFLLRKPMLAIYLIVLIIVNMIIGGLSMTYSAAAVDFSSLYRMHNEERAKRDLAELTINPLLINSATAKARAMLAADCWSHYCPEGKSPWDFFDDAGYVYVYAGENLAEGFVDNNVVMSAWLDSPTHRENILNTKFTEIGIGFAQGDYQGIKNNTVIVVHFGNKFDLINTKMQVDLDKEDTSSGINITEPRDGDAFKNNNFIIKGESKEVESVTLYANSEKLADINLAEGVFTYRPTSNQFIKEGDYSIYANGITFGRNINSNSVKVIIDTTPPKINSTSFKLSAAESGYLFELNIDSADQVKLVNLNENFQKGGNGTWQLFVNNFNPENTPSIIISANDKAGNASNLEIRTATVLSESTNNGLEVNLFKGSGIFNFKNETSIINFSFLLFMSGLFGIDYFVLKKSGLTNTQRSLPHLNIILFIVLAVIVLLGSSTGDILTGILLK